MTIRQQIDGLVREMVAKGILYEDASREFEARFISVALEEEGGSIGRAVDLAAEGVAVHPDPLGGAADAAAFLFERDADEARLELARGVLVEDALGHHLADQPVDLLADRHARSRPVRRR